MHDVIEKLRELNEDIPVPLELPDFDQLVEVEEQLLIPIPSDLKEYLLHASDVVYGSLEPVTASDPGSHCYLPEVAAHAWSIGVPRELIPICQLGEDFYCISQEGEVVFWQDGELCEDGWESFWHWVEQVWLNE